MVPLSRISPVGFKCQKQASQPGISKILHPPVFCEMQSPTPAGDNRLRQQSPHVDARAYSQVPNQLNDIHSTQYRNTVGVAYLKCPFFVLFLTVIYTGARNSWLAGPWFYFEQCQTSVLLCVGSRIPRDSEGLAYNVSQVVGISGIYRGFPAIRILRIHKCTGEIYCLS